MMSKDEDSLLEIGNIHKRKDGGFGRIHIFELCNPIEVRQKDA